VTKPILAPASTISLGFISKGIAYSRSPNTLPRHRRSDVPGRMITHRLIIRRETLTSARSIVFVPLRLNASAQETTRAKALIFVSLGLKDRRNTIWLLKIKRRKSVCSFVKARHYQRPSQICRLHVIIYLLTNTRGGASQQASLQSLTRPSFQLLCAVRKTDWRRR